MRLGVVGAGSRSSLATLATEYDAQIVAVADTTAAGRMRAVETFGTGPVVVESHTALSAADLDGAFVLTPDGTHAEIAVDLLRMGVPVYLEKPMAITVEDCDFILAVARETGTGLYVGHNMRHMPVIRLMRDLVLAGEIGEVKQIWCRHFVGHGGDFYFKDWHADRSQSTGLLLQKGAHDLDVIHWLGGAPTRQVVAMGDLQVYGGIADRRDNSDRLMGRRASLDNWPPLAQAELNPVIDVEDASIVTMRLANGVLASYEQCHFTPDYWRNYTVIGTEGRIENFGDSDGGVVRLWNRRSEYSAEGDRSYPIPVGEGTHGGADRAIVREFIDFLRGRRVTETSPVAARDAVAVGVAATESLRTGSVPRTIRPIEPELAAYFAAGQMS